MARQKRVLEGFTLAEVLVVLGLMALVLVTGSIASIAEFRGTGYRSDKEALVDALLFARARALSGGSHGVRVDTNSFTVFSGESYADRDPASDFPFARTAGTPSLDETEFIFVSRSGATIQRVNFEFGTSPRYEVEVSENGRIDSTTHAP